MRRTLPKTGHISGEHVTSLSHSFANSAANVTWSFTRNPASQIRTETLSNDAYNWDGHQDVTRNYAVNGLNQYTAVSGQAYCHDKNGNLTLDGRYVYLYDVENRLVEMRAKTNTSCLSLSYAGQLKAKLRYDPLGRLHEIEGFLGGVTQGVTRFLHDGDALVAEYNGSGAMLRRHAHGPLPGVDDPILSDEGAALDCSGTKVLHADARGSIVARANCSGVGTDINTYDEYGVPDTTTTGTTNFGADIVNKGRFRYTGQVWLPELAMYYYKARIYSPLLGRFMQTDPIGYEDHVNLYGYVGNDPVNGTDPTGQACDQGDDKGGCPDQKPVEEQDDEENVIVVTAKRVGQAYTQFAGIIWRTTGRTASAPYNYGMGPALFGLPKVTIIPEKAYRVWRIVKKNRQGARRL